MHYLSLNKKSSQPYYQQIEESIESAIRSGILTHGDRLATVNEVAQYFGVSIMAPRKAYELLERKKKVTSIKGKGTFVNARPQLVIPLEDYYKIEHFLPNKNWSLRSYITFLDQDREVTEILVHTHLNDYPISFHRFLFHVPVDHTRLKLHQGNVFDLNFINTITPMDVAVLETDFLAKSASPIDAQVLQIELGDPLIRMTALLRSADGTLIGDSDTLYPSAFVHFESRS